MGNYYRDVGDFHRKFDIPAYTTSEPCEFPAKEIVDYRVKFLEEEIVELKKAIDENDLSEVLDALADIVYVALGTAHYFNAPFVPIWDEVQRSNMERIKCTRENCPPDKQYRPDLIIKPPEWRGPQIQRVIDVHNRLSQVFRRPK